MTKKEAIMIIADQDNGNPAEIVAATEYLMSLEERKTGKWITDKKSVYAGAFLERECHCSECELRRNFIGFQFDDYCSHCGAKMEGFE